MDGEVLTSYGKYEVSEGECLQVMHGSSAEWLSVKLREIALHGGQVVDITQLQTGDLMVVYRIPIAALEE